MKAFFYGKWLSLLLFSTPLFAQPYCPEERNLAMGSIVTTAWMVAVDQEPVEALQTRLREYTRERYRVHLRPDHRDSELLIAKRAMMPTVTYLSGSLLARVYCEGDTTMLAVAYLPDYGDALTTKDHPQDMQNLWSFARHFVKYYKVHRIQDQMEEAYRWRSDWEYSYEKDEQEIRKLTRTIQRLDKRIARTDGAAREKWQERKIALERRVAELKALLVIKNREIARTYTTLRHLKSELTRIEQLFDEPVRYEWGPPDAVVYHDH